MTMTGGISVVPRYPKKRPVLHIGPTIRSTGQIKSVYLNITKLNNTRKLFF